MVDLIISLLARESSSWTLFILEDASQEAPAIPGLLFKN